MTITQEIELRELKSAAETMTREDLLDSYMEEARAHMETRNALRNTRAKAREEGISPEEAERLKQRIQKLTDRLLAALGELEEIKHPATA